MKYYIAADGGGTKLQAVLYDEELRMVSAARVSGVIACTASEGRSKRRSHKNILHPFSYACSA